MYTGLVSSLSRDLTEKRRLEEVLKAKRAKIAELEVVYNNFVGASKVISAVADKTSMETLDYITGVINKTLGELFKSDTRRIYLQKKMHSGKYAHLNVILTDEDARTYSLKVQSGTGLRQVISFLFALCLLQISGGRKLFVQDEILGGTHGAAKDVLSKIIKLFSKEFQFIMVEYGFDDIGKIYNVEKVGKVAKAYEVEDGTYDGKAIFISSEGFSKVSDNIELQEEE